MMTYAQLLANYEGELVKVGEEAQALKFVFRELRGLSLTDLVMILRNPVTAEDAELMEHIFQQLLQHKPAQYILGYADFADMRLKVDERVLIPRPETEELVQLILEENAGDGMAILDMCTGSGALALALKKNRPSWQVSASDISQEAIDLAKENANVQVLPIKFILSDLFRAISDRFDIIVANPPYISPGDRAEVELNVLTWEPHLALFAEEEGLAIYRRLAQEAGVHLKDRGKIYLEIGYKQGPTVSALFQEQFPNRRIRVIRDSLGHDRMVVVDGG